MGGAWEGNICNTDIAGNCPTSVVQTPPFFTYTHVAGRCSVTGGYVYRGNLSTLPNGAYTFADYCTGEIWLWNNNAQVLFQDTPRQVVSFGEDEDGEIYVCYANVSGSAQIDKIVPVVSVSGHVLTPAGPGLRNAVVALTDPQSVSRTGITDSFGFYQFDNVPIGQTYTMNAVSKRYRFTSQQVSVSAALTGVDFVGQE